MKKPVLHSLFIVVAVILAMNVVGCQPAPSNNCAASELECDGICIDVETDDDNCGACGNECDPGDICEDTHCVPECHGNTEPCGDQCVDTDTDEDNCGECDLVCSPSEECVIGLCTSI